MSREVVDPCVVGDHRRVLRSQGARAGAAAAAAENLEPFALAAAEKK